MVIREKASYGLKEMPNSVSQNEIKGPGCTLHSGLFLLLFSFFF